MKYVALLRGINVGGNNIIKMVSLKACFEKLGFDNVSTFIQSGNVLFDAKDSSEVKIETALSKEFSYTASVVVVSHKELADVVKHAPKGFGTEPEKFRYDVLFLRPELKAADAIKIIPTKEGVDSIAAGKSVIYFSRLISKATQSKLSRVASMPIYKQLTIRNWNTTTKLLALLEK